VPLAHPEQAHVVSKPAILADLAARESHGEAPEDIAAAAKAAAEARAKGGFTATIHGTEIVVGPRFVAARLDSIVKARGGAEHRPAPTAPRCGPACKELWIASSTRPPPGMRPGPGPSSATTSPSTRPWELRAARAPGTACCSTFVTRPTRAGSPPWPTRTFAFWHSATFNNDGTKLLFTDEWGGGLAPKCRVTDKPEWGADAIFTVAHDTLTFRSYYKLPAPQTSNENCVAHNGSLVPVPGATSWSRAGIRAAFPCSTGTDPAHPKEIAYFDRGPMDSTKLVGAGSWSAYWYNGYIVSSEIGRGWTCWSSCRAACCPRTRSTQRSSCTSTT